MAKKPKKEAKQKFEDATTTVPRKVVTLTPRKRKPKAVQTNKESASQSPPIDPTREPSDDEIRLRAYFIAERRLQLCLEGDSTHDWLEARRQLVEESKLSSS